MKDSDTERWPHIKELFEAALGSAPDERPPSSMMPANEDIEMTPERWQQVKNLFHSALERESHHRALFLDEACAGDLLLRREVESLITSHEQTGSFIDSPAYELGAELLTRRSN